VLNKAVTVKLAELAGARAAFDADESRACVCCCCGDRGHCGTPMTLLLPMLPTAASVRWGCRREEADEMVIRAELARSVWRGNPECCVVFVARTR
jgi:hypothetical protein